MVFPQNIKVDKRHLAYLHLARTSEKNNPTETERVRAGNAPINIMALTSIPI